MTNLIWLVFIFLVGTLVVSVLWFIWRLRHFSNSHNQSFLDDKLMQSMLGDETLSKELKSALAGKRSGAHPVAPDPSVDAAKEPAACLSSVSEEALRNYSEIPRKTNGQSMPAGQRSRTR